MVVSTQVTQAPLRLDKSVPVHFIGIGGIGMSGLAKLLVETGFTVSGSDPAENANTKALAAQGATIHHQHVAENVPLNGMIIATTAINPQNPEIRQALEHNIPIYHRSDLLREILQGPEIGHEVTIGMTGTHGKTTITGMTGLVLQAGGLEPTIVAGGKIPGLETNAVLGASRKYAVAELDESDGTIVKYTPTLSAVTNLELDHADHYTGGLADLFKTFHTFLGNLKPGSKVLYNLDCPNTVQLMSEAPGRIEALGFSLEPNHPQAKYHVTDVRAVAGAGYAANLYYGGEKLGELALTVPGRHNLANAIVAAGIGHQLGVPFEAIRQALKEFKGMGRRFDIVGEYNGATLVDDYAHHPTEVQVTLQAARERAQATGGRVIAVFQPHRFTRLQALWNEFLGCFDAADRMYLTDVYAASEEPIPGVTSEAFAQAHGKARYIGADFDAIRKELKTVAQPGDFILSMGAGSITKLLREFDKA
jgi:UDP-N-acetylmuramate--alanine ligase